MGASKESTDIKENQDDDFFSGYQDEDKIQN